MKWKSVIEKWFGDAKPLNRKNQVTEDNLQEEADPITLAMLKKKGFETSEIEEMVTATNLLHCSIFGDLEIEVEKMFAIEVLHKYGFEGIEDFDSKLHQFAQR